MRPRPRRCGRLPPAAGRGHGDPLPQRLRRAWQRRHPTSLRACLRLLASGELRLRHLITHVVPYTEAEAMFRMMARGGDDWMGIVFTWDE